jgi:GT2 family glycosyltransferase
VVNFNGRAVIADCLTSILRQDYGNFRVVVVDNGSTDGSAEMVADKFPGVELVRLNTNQGFARANNVALRRMKNARPEFVAFVNTDVVLEEGWLRALAEFVTREQFDCGQTLITQAASPDLIDACGIGVSRRLRVYDRKRGEPVSHAPDSEAVFGPCFAAALLRRNVLESIGTDGAFFDERYDTFYEDVDVCFRANSRGLKAGLLAQPLCTHTRSFSADRMPFRKYFLLGRNYFLLLARHLPPGYVLKEAPWILAERLGFWIRASGRPACSLGFLIGALRGIAAAGCLPRSLRGGGDAPTAAHRELLAGIRDGRYE